jgi:hypothetical protein
MTWRDAGNLISWTGIAAYLAWGSPWLPFVFIIPLGLWLLIALSGEQL